MIQKLKRSQLVQLHNKFENNAWKKSIEEILVTDIASGDNKTFEIPQVFLYFVDKYCTEEQQKSLEEFGIILNYKKKIIEDFFWANFNEGVVSLEKEFDREVVVYRNKENISILDYETAHDEHVSCHYNRKIFSLLEEKTNYTPEQIKSIIKKLVNDSLKINISNVYSTGGNVVNTDKKKIKQTTPVELFWSLFKGCKVSKEGDKIVYRNKAKEWLFVIEGDCFYYSYEVYERFLLEHRYDNIQKINDLIQEIVNKSLKLKDLTVDVGN